jgi:Cytochrome C oxidase, cbb3-type, subunit III
MDYPLFSIDVYGGRLVIGLIAILHVLINHPLAVGASLLVARLESRGIRTRDPRWDTFAYKLIFFCFLITTTFGALTGVGIWLTTALVNPEAIGSLLRVFFWAWFIEWLVFISEVVLLLIYTLTWQRWVGAHKPRHLRIGYIFAACSWVTMALITAILGFMMDPGNWHGHRSLIDGLMNPLYLPQLVFRTCLAMAMAGAVALLAAWWLTERGSSFRMDVVRFCCRWMALWGVPLVASGWWYLGVVPPEMLDRAPVAFGSLATETWFPYLLSGLFGLTVGCACIAISGWWRPWQVPRWAYVLPLLVLLLVLAVFERTREFVRKPWVIGGYLYANGIRAEDYPLYRAEGLLKHHPYATVRVITESNRLDAGHQVFRIACATCHSESAHGLTSVHDSFERILGRDAWVPSAVSRVIAGMHGTRSFMPEFPGTPAERNALAVWIVQQHSQVRPGVAAPPRSPTPSKKITEPSAATVVPAPPPPSATQPTSNATGATP